MTNVFDKVINTFMKVNGGEEDEVIIALRAKKEELGPDASEAEIHEAIKSVLEAHLSIESDSLLEQNNSEHQEYLESSCEAIQLFLDSNDFKYDVHHPSSRVTIYRLDCGHERVRLRASIACDAINHICRFKFSFPFNADEAYEYPLCNKLIDLTRNTPIGYFGYDSSDGEIYLWHDILTRNKLHPEDLDRIFFLMAHSAITPYKDLCKYSYGSFSRREASGIVEKATQLINELNATDE